MRIIPGVREGIYSGILQDEVGKNFRQVPIRMVSSDSFKQYTWMMLSPQPYERSLYPSLLCKNMIYLFKTQLYLCEPGIGIIC